MGAQEELVLGPRLPAYTLLNVAAVVLCVMVTAGAGLMGPVMSLATVMSAAVCAAFALVGYALAPSGVHSESSGFRKEVLAVALPAVHALMFISLLSGTSGAVFYWVTIIMAAALLPLYRVKLPSPDIRIGVFGGVVMFVTAVIITALFSVASAEAVLAWQPVDLQAPEQQVYAVQMLLVVALAEELWARLTALWGGAAVAGVRTAAFWSTFWFLFAHVPSRLRYGLQAPVIIAVLGTVLAVFLIFYRVSPSVWTAVVMHGTYNTLLAGMYYGTLIAELVLLAVLVYAISKLTQAKLELTIPEVVRVEQAG